MKKIKMREYDFGKYKDCLEFQYAIAAMLTIANRLSDTYKMMPEYKCIHTPIENLIKIFDDINELESLKLIRDIHIEVYDDHLLYLTIAVPEYLKLLEIE